MSKKTEFDALKKTWYKKLKDETDFVDIEYAEDDLIKRGHSDSRHYKDPELRQLVQDYYCMAYYFLNEFTFESELDRVTWEYYSNGISIRNIVKLINNTAVDKTNRIRVWKLIKKLEITMKAMYLIP